MNLGIIVDNEFNDDIRVRKEVEILKAAGHNIYVLCYGYHKKGYPVIDGVQIERIGINRKIKDILFFFFNRIPVYEFLWRKEISRFIKGHSIDIIHAHDLYLSKAAYKGAKLSKRDCPVVLDLHENYPAVIQDYNWTRGTVRHLLSAPQKWAKKEDKYLSYASKIIVLSDTYKNELIQKYSFLNSANIVAFPNVIDFKRFESFKIHPIIIKRKENVTLFYFGTVAERRGIFDAIEALRNVLKKGHEANLLIVGPVDKADKESFHTTIIGEDVKSYIKYIPWIPLSELVSYLKAVDICLAPFIKNPQHESGVANKIYQYMYGGKPIIASDCLPQKGLIESADCGLIYSNQDEFAEHIIYLMDHADIRKKMGENGYKELYKKYNNMEFSNILVDLYGNIKPTNSEKDNKVLQQNT